MIQSSDATIWKPSRSTTEAHDLAAANIFLVRPDATRWLDSGSASFHVFMLLWYEIKYEIWLWLWKLMMHNEMYIKVLHVVYIYNIYRYCIYVERERDFLEAAFGTEFLHLLALSTPQAWVVRSVTACCWQRTQLLERLKMFFYVLPGNQTCFQFTMFP